MALNHFSPMSRPSSSIRRRFGLALAFTAASLVVGAAHAQVPRQLRILVGFPAGGGTDAIARILADGLKDELAGATVIVENKPGAGGQLAAQALKVAAADGQTVFLTHDHTISILPQVVKTPGFDPAVDFVPVAGFATFVNALAVSGGTPARTLAEYTAWVKAQGGKGSVGVPAPASVPEFLVKLIGEKYKLDLVAVPYRGSAPMMADMLGNQIASGIASVPPPEAAVTGAAAPITLPGAMKILSVARQRKSSLKSAGFGDDVRPRRECHDRVSPG